MATIKSFTDIDQSKRLAEILPLDSADMCIGNYVGKSGKVDGTNVHYYLKGEIFGAPEIIAAWSLAALLDILSFPELCYNIEDGEGGWIVGCKKNDKGYLSCYKDNPVDTCYEMILKLNELNLL